MQSIPITNFCASAALRRKACATVTALNSPLASCGASCSTLLSVILISSAVRMSFAMGTVFKGGEGISGKAGSIAASVASRCFCLSAATSCHVAPEAIVTVAAMVSINIRQYREGGM